MYAIHLLAVFDLPADAENSRFGASPRPPDTSSGEPISGQRNQALPVTATTLALPTALGTETQMRPSGRAPDHLREVSLEPGVNKYAEGSCFARFGDTHVLCIATVEQRVPPWLRDSGRGWVTAEYGMLPRSTSQRTDREAARGRQSGRTLEIQRLIGRSLRAVTNLAAMPEMQIRIDCDVIQADGGTRTAAITGAYVALHLAFGRVKALGLLDGIPLTDQVAAVSCGLYNGAPVLDLD
jgi:ribonuclease PH